MRSLVFISAIDPMTSTQSSKGTTPRLIALPRPLATTASRSRNSCCCYLPSTLSSTLLPLAAALTAAPPPLPADGPRPVPVVPPPARLARKPPPISPLVIHHLAAVSSRYS
eukprot:2324199-Prymnesium_polylepis.1